MENTDEIREKIYQIVQNFLKNPPLIVWGSGATISFGLPSMNDLNLELKSKIDNFNTKNDNLETELGKDKYLQQMPQIKQTIWDKVNASDLLVLKKIISNSTTDFLGIKLLIEKFIEVHPQTVNIVTTNYDRVLEYVFSYYDFQYTDGFNGKILSTFNENLFGDKRINIIKVHGSLNWFEVNSEIRFMPSNTDCKIPKIIVPGKNKYQEGYVSPYRELIQKADSLIKTACSFLVIGFGFNDAHLTPEIKAKVKQGTPIVLITKKITNSSFEELKNADKYILFEALETDKTKIIYKENSKEQKQEIVLEGNLWELYNFMEIL